MLRFSGSFKVNVLSQISCFSVGAVLLMTICTDKSLPLLKIVTIESPSVVGVPKQVISFKHSHNDECSMTRETRLWKVLESRLLLSCGILTFPIDDNSVIS